MFFHSTAKAIKALAAAAVADAKAVAAQADATTAIAAAAAAAALASTKHQFIHRGDPESYDFTVGDFTQNSQWHELDLSAIVDAGAVGVFLFVFMTATGTGQSVRFRPSGNENAYNIQQQEIVVDAKPMGWLIFVPLNGLLTIDYVIYSTAYSVLNVSVIGWVM